MKCFLWVAKSVFLLGCCLIGTLAHETSSEKILIRDITALTLVPGLMTSGRRVAAVPQAQCRDGHCDLNTQIDVIRCKNDGFDGNDVQWSCRAHGLPSTYTLTRVVVSCEGYDYPTDKYVLVNSCGVSYSISRKRGSPLSAPSAPHRRSSPSSISSSSQNYYPSGNTEGDNLNKQHHQGEFSYVSAWAKFGTFILVGVLVYHFCSSRGERRD